MNDQGIQQGIRKRIDSLPADAVFTATDFADIAGSDSTRQAFKQLNADGVIARAARGVYYKPHYSEALRQHVPPNIDALARAIARARGWEIIPSGDHALNMLGLDNQVPAVYTYISTGPYTSIQAGAYEIRFKHAANKNITGMSTLTALVVQALKALGQDNITKDVIAHLAGRLNSQEKEALLSETNRSTAWIRQAVLHVVERQNR